MGNKQSSGDLPPPSDSGNPSDGNRSVETASSATNTAANNPSYYTIIKNSYQQLVNAIIRPPRCRYTIEQLGPKEFSFCGKRFQRNDFTLTNPRNLKFECSLWEPIPSDRASERLPCVIYMHGNSSARIEALSTLSVVIGMGATLLAIDFAGSGLSEGEYVSLGAFEKDDLAAAIEHLRKGQQTSTIALWGRSMGAATALLHAERDPSIAGMILDSAFSDLVILAEDMVEKGRQQGLFAPSFLVYVAIKFVRSSVLKAADFDIRSLSPIEHADRCFVPALFIAAENDSFVLPRHSQAIHDKYGGDKNLVLVEGDHNSPRPRYLYDSIAIFLQQTLQLPPSWVLSGSENYVRRLPWSSSAASSSSSGSHPQRSFVTLNDHNNSHSNGTDNNSERQRLQAYIARQQQKQQDQSETVARPSSGTQKVNKPAMYESDTDENDADNHSNYRDQNGLMVHESALTDAETELLMLELMDEDEQLALAIAQSVADANTNKNNSNNHSNNHSSNTVPDEDGHAMADIQAIQNEGELVMEQNVQDSLFSLLGGGTNNHSNSTNYNSNTSKPPVHHRPLAKTKATSSSSSSNHKSLTTATDSTTTNDNVVVVVIPDNHHTANNSHNHVPMSPTAMLAAQQLLQQQQQQQQSIPSSMSDNVKEQKHVFFGEDEEDLHESISANSKQSNKSASNNVVSRSNSSNSSNTASPRALPAFPTSMASSASNSAANSSYSIQQTTITNNNANNNAHKIASMSSFHTFHNVFDTLDTTNNHSSSNSSLPVPPPRSTSSSASTSSADLKNTTNNTGTVPSRSSSASSSSSRRPPAAPPISVSQLLSMADPFDDEEEVEIVDAEGNKSYIMRKKKKVDDFADDNNEPIAASEIVGMEETLAELTDTLGSTRGDEAFWSKLSALSAASANSSQYQSTTNTNTNASNDQNANNSSTNSVKDQIISNTDHASFKTSTTNSNTDIYSDIGKSASFTSQRDQAKMLLGDEDDD